MNVIKIGSEFDQNASDLAHSGVLYESHCLKRRVVAAIYADEEMVAIGWNGPEREPESCPRLGMESGERYDLCDSNCPGQLHAEEDALEDFASISWDFDVDDLVMYVYGHDHICSGCQERVGDCGIETIYLVLDEEDIPIAV